RHSRLHGEHGAQALAAGEDRVAHGAVNGGRNGARGGDKFLERAVRQLRAFLNERLYVGRHRSNDNLAAFCFRSNRYKPEMATTQRQLNQAPAMMSGVVLQTTKTASGPSGTGTAISPSSRGGRLVTILPLTRTSQAGYVRRRRIR